MAWPRGKPKSPEIRAKIREAKLGRSATPEHASAIKAGVTEWWRRRKSAEVEGVHVAEEAEPALEQPVGVVQ